MRKAEIERKTKETEITVAIDLDGSGRADIETGVGFFDHMLTAVAVHGGFDLSVRCGGDLDVDAHHSVEDVGIVLGQAFAQALGDKAGIARYGSFLLPMDEALAQCAVDLSGRAYFVWDAAFTADKIGELDTQMVPEFFRAFAVNAKATLHLNLLYGENDHHRAEALFKAFAHALRIAVARAGADAAPVLSTKGSL
ncbi:MAG: imidazoleglycerol-phosphate dehydratase HisB [Clostridiales Family XIII bacterium]|jgi:imidazoleglycerol-phosphate dehydratase|nr:imidazoleglycerol-phosphate dehydratase HisB [Clostridiales Family XIII bacterium]